MSCTYCHRCPYAFHTGRDEDSRRVRTMGFVDQLRRVSVFLPRMPPLYAFSILSKRGRGADDACLMDAALMLFTSCMTG